MLRLATVLRTPGHDFELVAGFLYGEGLLAKRAELEGMRYCNEPQEYNRVQALLRRPLGQNERLAQRLVLAASGCGACGRPELPKTGSASPETPPRVPLRWLQSLESQVDQQLFARTGGTHAAALFALERGLLALHEDVGRHNAVDKIVGELFLDDRLPPPPSLLWLSGRIGYELVQKAAQAGIPAIAALGAPTSLAVSTAKEHGLFLAGFLAKNRVNVYTGELT